MSDPCPHYLVLPLTSFGPRSMPLSPWSLGALLVTNAEDCGWWPPGASSPDSERAQWSHLPDLSLLASREVLALFPACITLSQLQWHCPC